MTTTLIKSKKDLFKKSKNTPQLAIITGSGIKLFEGKEPICEARYENIFPASKLKAQNSKLSIQGHEKKLKFYKIKEQIVLVFSGRRHLYEGLEITDIVANVKLAYELGAKKILITNAAGGINKDFKASDLMLITSFINLMQPNERGVLSGLVEKPKEIKTKLTVYIKQKFKKIVQTGIYAANTGPSYETYSEIKLLQLLGADAIGMSTIPELICAKSLGMDFAGISIISNIWDSKHKPSHLEVLKNVSKANKKLNDLVLELLD